MSCTCLVCGVVYIWHFVHVVQVVRCTCGGVYVLCRWCHVHVMLCTRCAGGVVYSWYVHVVHVVLCAYRTCCVVYMWYYVCALCSHAIMTCVFIMLYVTYMYCVVHQVKVCVLFGGVHQM